ncbi:hypothetical protein LW682_004361 [Salmonella enterica]|nr:hypothetical protein [Salmonella enterica]ELR0356274.1 hypothetical protein [Salmonella enterica]
MSDTAGEVRPRYEETIGMQLLSSPVRPLTAGELNELWSLVERIEETWFTQRCANSIKPQWLDYVQTSVSYSSGLLGEYENALSVYKEVLTIAPERASEMLILRPVPTLSTISSRLDHAKHFVIDRFIRCYVMLVGFQEFGGRNYNGYMAGSRFADTPPVRIGRRQ